MKTRWCGVLLAGMVVVSLSATDALSGDHGNRGNGHNSGRREHSNYSSDRGGWDSAGSFAVGLLLGQVLQPPVRTTYVSTREIVYTPRPPAPVYYETRTVYYPTQPMVQTVMVAPGQPMPVYQTVVPTQTTYVQQWNGYCWQTVAVQQPSMR